MQEKESVQIGIMMDQRFIKTSAYFFTVIFLLFLFVENEVLLMTLITIAGLIWIFDGFRGKKDLEEKDRDKTNSENR
ncbi:MAG: hypothetical protein QNJ78_13330 [Gammaproteobacteria bacterium]|nr:hypothetical protein [Gammaproteobacteria bacterium]